MSQAIFLDRDGVINFERGDYTFRIEDFSFVDGIIDACIEWTNKGYPIIIITNQGGIAKKRYGHKNVAVLHQHIIDQLSESGVSITDVYYCPHHSEIESCYCRKPKPLMIERALHQHNLKSENCVIIGDSDRDIDAANQAGVQGIKITANHLPNNIIELVEDVFQSR